MSDKNFRVRHGLEVDGDASLTGDLTVTGNEIKGNGGATAITISGADVAVAGDLTVTGNDIKGSIGTTALTLSGQNVAVAGDLTISGNDLKGAGGVTALSMNSGSVTLADDLTITGNTINLAQTTDIFYSENNSRVNRPQVQSTTGDSSGFRVLSPNTTTSASATLSVFSTNDIANGEFLSTQASGSTTNPFAFRIGKYTSNVLGASGKPIIFTDAGVTFASVNPSGPTNGTDLTTKTYVDAHPGTTYDIDATSATGGVNFNLNGSDSTTDTIKFTGGSNVTITATSANEITFVASDTDTKYTIDASSTTGGANLNLVGSDSTTDTVKFASGTGVTVSQTSANEMSIAIGQAVGTGDSPSFAGLTAGNVTVGLTDDNTITTTTGDLTINAAGGDVNFDANVIAKGQLNTYDNFVILNYDTTGSPTDNGGIEIERGTDPNVRVRWLESADRWGFTNDGTNYYNFAEQALDTTSTPTFAGLTAGNISVGVATDNTIASTDTNGNIVLDPNGTGVIIFDSIQRLRGESQATTNNSYTFPTSQLTTVSDNNGYSAASSFGTTGSGYQANAQYIHYTGDTAAGANAVASLNFRQANGNSVTGQNLPWTGINSVAPSASVSGDVLGTTNYNGYATTGFANDIATQYQGGGVATTHIVQFQTTPAETLANGTLTLTSANITAVASSFRAALGNPQVTGTKGQISFNATTPGVGQAIRVTGTLTGTATGIVSGQNYYIIATSSTTTATLSATPNGPPIDTTAGTLTGLTLTRCGVTFTLAGQTSYPFGRNALVTVANVTNVTDGTYPVAGGVTSLTSITLGIPHTVAPTLPGTQQFTIPTVTNAGGGYRIRALPTATPMNPANRLNLVDHTAASCTLRANSFTFAAGSYGGTGATYAVIDTNKALFSKPVRTSITTGTVAKGGTYTPAATAQNSIVVEITAGAGTTSIDVNNLTVAGENGMYDILVYNNSGGSLNANDIEIINGVGNIVLQHNSSIANGARAVFEVNCIDIYAAASFMATAV